MVFNKMIYLVTSIHYALPLPGTDWELKQYLSAQSPRSPVSTNKGEDNLSIIYFTQKQLLPPAPALRQ